MDEYMDCLAHKYCARSQSVGNGKGFVGPPGLRVAKRISCYILLLFLADYF
jgi:hypothetical protein